MTILYTDIFETAELFGLAMKTDTDMFHRQAISLLLVIVCVLSF